MQDVSPERVARLLAGLSRFSEPGPGVTRLGYSELDKKAQEWLLGETGDLGLAAREDAAGNLILRREGEEKGAAAVACGSHIDTVRCGGAYDGACGVVGALEALYMLRGEKLRRPVEAMIFRCEESAAFGVATVGSKLMTGNAGLKELDISGGISRAMRSWGLDPGKCKGAAIDRRAYECFVELHIEQGRLLEAQGRSIGIVRNIAAPTRLKIRVAGISDHSGATPMGMRRDALVGAAKIVLAVNEAAKAESAWRTVGTVGVLEVKAGSVNTVPGDVTMWADLRGTDMASVRRAVAAVRLACDKAAEEEGLKIGIELVTEDTPVALSHELSDLSEAILREKGISFLGMDSGAGHDAMQMAKVMPAAMLFVPCRAGISHSPEEYAKNEDICRGIEVLAEFIRRKATE